MGLSRLAEQFAAEIRWHDWSDVLWRADRAGHNRELDSPAKRTPQHTAEEVECCRLNVMWVTAQVLAYNDPWNFNIVEFAEACGVDFRPTRSGQRLTFRPTRKSLEAGLRGTRGNYDEPDTASCPTRDQVPRYWSRFTPSRLPAG